LERLTEHLFILASIDRLTLLSEIAIERRRLSQLSTKLSATPQETSKHLTRLRDAKLIEKDSDGFFCLTAFGRIMLNLLPSIRFLTQNREYFSLLRYERLNAIRAAITDKLATIPINKPRIY